MAECSPQSAGEDGEPALSGGGPDPRLARAAALLLAGQAPKASQLLSALIKERGPTALALCSRAQAHLANDLPRRALKDCDSGIALDPGLLGLYDVQGSAFEARKLLARSRASLEARCNWGQLRVATSIGGCPGAAG
ncbi:hypothetical protein FNF27_07515 [Cafeteria roenbergensis]|uniref:Uncharacterized protein n=1 Tax=Cafeteria roenbergensis TaxID=33653 RepID=A0A5A8DLF8_CAFRO|nr:hypothetical protein FNF27_07515 [Cafeteria roenbergensis]